MGVKTVFLLDTSVNSQKKHASRLDETSGRCLTIERNQCFFLNSQMYGVKTLLLEFAHEIIIVFSKDLFY